MEELLHHHLLITTTFVLLVHHTTAVIASGIIISPTNDLILLHSATTCPIATPINILAIALYRPSLSTALSQHHRPSSRTPEIS